MENDTTVQKEGSTETEIQGSVALEISFNDILDCFVDGYGKKDSDDAKARFAGLLAKQLKQEIEKHSCAKDYNILILHDNTTMIKGDSDRVYKAISTLEKNQKPLLLILLSRGGEPGPAYLIGQLCRESSNGKFVVVVPRHAKSAATLLATAANEIHMGSLSELGPIDPQIDRKPALGLKNSIEHIAGLVTKFPESGQMFARYLYLTVEPIQIGHYERVAESAVQYAEKLLNGHKESLSSTPEEIAKKLVYGYKDHGFVIDKAEAKNIFGEKIIKSNSEEYDLGNALYNVLLDVEELADVLGYNFYFIGSIESKPELVKKKKRN